MNNNYITIKEAARLLNKSVSTIYNTPNKEIPRHKQGSSLFFKRDEIEFLIKSRDEALSKLEEKVKELYNNKSIRAIARELSIDQKKVKLILTKFNITIKNSSEIKTIFKPLNINIFDSIDSEEKAYFLGLLWADGCNLTKLSQIQISLQERDKDILLKFSEFIFGKNMLRFCKRNEPRQNQYKLIITNPHISKKLDEYGFNNRRNFYYGLPNCHIPKEIFHHFIRGLWDGDGSIYFIKYSQDYASQFIGSVKLCEELKSILECYYNFNINIVKDDDYSQPMKRLNCHGNKKVQTLLDIIYNRASVFLKRKYDIYKTLSSINNTSTSDAGQS
jgi:excisionase family DNA binding protein